ncbi:MAG: nucleotide exchange factor GrpE [Christensenellales bacterium]|jgi:molecular chaperone GrpE
MAKKKKEDIKDEIKKDNNAEPELKAEPETEINPDAQAQDPNDDASTRLEEAQKKCDEYLLMAQRAQADFDNYKRRNETAKSQAYLDGVSDALSAILPALDNFDRAVEAIVSDEASNTMFEGVLMVKKQLDGILAAKGVSIIPSAKGDAFDPELHNAVMTASLEEGFEAGQIAATLQKGYKLNDKVIRYAMVSVFSE